MKGERRSHERKEQPPMKRIEYPSMQARCGRETAERENDFTSSHRKKIHGNSINDTANKQSIS